MTSVEQLLNSGIAALKSNNPGAAVVSAKQLAQRTSVSEDPQVVELGNQLSAVADLVAAKVGPPKPLNVAVPFSPANPPPGPVDELNPFTEEGKAAIAINQAEQTALSTRRRQAATTQLNTANVTSKLRDQEAERRKPFEAEAKSAGFNSIEQAKTEEERLRRINTYINETADPNWAALNAPLVKMARKVRGTPLEEQYDALKEYVLQKQISQRAPQIAEQTARVKQGFKTAEQKEIALKTLLDFYKNVNEPTRTDWTDLLEQIVEAGPLFKGTALEQQYNRLKNTAFEKQLAIEPQPPSGRRLGEAVPAVPSSTGLNTLRQALQKSARAPILAAATQKAKGRLFNAAEQARATRRLANIRQGTEIRQFAPSFPRRAGASPAKNAANLAALTQRQPVITEGEGRVPEANTSALFGAPRPAYSPTGLQNTSNANIFQRERAPNTNQRPLGSTAIQQQSLWAEPTSSTAPVGIQTRATKKVLNSFLAKGLVNKKEELKQRVAATNKKAALLRKRYPRAPKSEVKLSTNANGEPILEVSGSVAMGEASRNDPIQDGGFTRRTRRVLNHTRRFF